MVMTRAPRKPPAAFLAGVLPAILLLATSTTTAASPLPSRPEVSPAQVAGAAGVELTPASAAGASPSAPLPPAASRGLEALPAGASGELQFSELPNFHRVDENLFRSGQPGKGGMVKLKEVGVRTVLNLRYEQDQSRAEEAAAKANGLQYFNVPMYGLARPTQAQISRALALLDDSRNWPVLVHCERGSDRTGAVVACYRIEHSKWTAEKAIQEAMGYGMMRIEILKRAFIRDFFEKRPL